MAVQADVFKHALGHFASGVTVVTLGNEEEKTGITVSAFCSVSLDPPYILICINKESSTLELLQERKTFAVNFLAEDQGPVSNQFARPSTDKFQGVDYEMGTLNVPVLQNTLGYLECTVANQVSAGDHDVVIGQVENAQISGDKEPLLYYHGSYGQFKS